MSERYPDPLQQVRETARDRAKDIDRYAVCCSDGAFEYARTEDVATDILDSMRTYHESQRPGLDFEYDVITLGVTRRTKTDD